MERVANPEEDKDQPPSDSSHLPYEGGLAPFLMMNQTLFFFEKIEGQ